MRKVWWVLGVGVLSLPLVFVMWLLAAVRLPAMDATTQRLPISFRSMVADSLVSQGAAGEVGGSNIERAKKLDIASVDRAVARIVTTAPPRHALSTDDSGEAKQLYTAGLAQANSGRSCEAAETFTKAAGRDSADDAHYQYTEQMGREALLCGDLLDARAGLETAIEKEDRYLADPNEAEDKIGILRAKADSLLDSAYLSVIYGRISEPQLALHACMKGHPEWAICSCRLKGSTPVCSGR